MYDFKKTPQMTRTEAMNEAKDFFKGKSELITLVDRSLYYKDRSSNFQPVEFCINIKTLLEEFQNIPAFDENLTYYGNSLFIMGSRSRIYQFEEFKKVFPNL
jgi:hypothetical protein